MYKRQDVPIVTRVITADEIKKVDATHIGDLLQAELPGIEFSYSMDQQVSLKDVYKRQLLPFPSVSLCLVFRVNLL